MGEVAQRRRIGSGAVTDLELIVMRQRVAHRHIEVAREAVFTIGKNRMHLDDAVVGRSHIPNALVGTNETTMKRVLTVVLGQLIGNTIQCERTIGDAVGATSDHGTKITFAVVVQILVDMVVTQDDVLKAVASVGHPKGYHTATIIGHLHRQKTIVQGIKRHLLALHFRVEVFGRNQFDFFLTIATD